ncbi:MAG: hypothetical protein WCX29_04225, partial [Candidatus Peribacteraceae bacterium]
RHRKFDAKVWASRVSFARIRYLRCIRVAESTGQRVRAVGGRLGVGQSRCPENGHLLESLADHTVFGRCGVQQRVTGAIAIPNRGDRQPESHCRSQVIPMM